MTVVPGSHPSASPPSVDDLAGVAPDFTGTRSTEEFMDWQRGPSCACGEGGSPTHHAAAVCVVGSAVYIRPEVSE